MQVKKKWGVQQRGGWEEDAKEIDVIESDASAERGEMAS